MKERMRSSYDLLIDMLDTTMLMIREVRFNRAELTNIKLQIGVLSDMIKSFERLRKDLIQIEMDMNN